MASPEVLDYLQLAEARHSASSDVTAGAGDVTLDEKGGGYIYVLAEDRAVRLPHEALLEAAQLFKQGKRMEEHWRRLVKALGKCGTFGWFSLPNARFCVYRCVSHVFSMPLRALLQIV